MIFSMQAGFLVTKHVAGCGDISVLGILSVCADYAIPDIDLIFSPSLRDEQR
jgi:hypothetical protein